MLTPTDITGMRDTQETVLPDICTRTRLALVPDGAGGYTLGVPSTISLPCRISVRGVPQEFLQLGASSGRQFVMITLPQGSDVVRTDTLTVRGVTYEIVGFENIGEWETAIRAVCEVLT